MTIWEIMRRLHDEDDFTYAELEEFNEGLGHEARDRIQTVLNKRMDSAIDLRICQASDWLFPHYLADVGVGHNDGDDFCRIYMERSSDDYVWAFETRYDAGWCHSDYTYWVEGEDIYITDERYRNHYYTCSHCDVIVHEDRAIYSDVTHEHYCCSECCSEDGGYDSDEDEDDDDDSVIYGYSTRIDRVKYWSADPGVRYFGLELEQEFPGASPRNEAGWAMDNIHRLDQVAIWKSDGSLSNGAELVTLPMTLQYWQGDNPVKALCANQRWRATARSHNTTTCGLHVHVSRNTIPEPVVAKIVYLMNEPCMREIVTLVARRSATHSYATAQKKRWHSDENCRDRYGYDENGDPCVNPPWRLARSAKDIYKKQQMQCGRYTPVNLTEHTIEFRIFKGTLKWETVLASIEFCEAVISYCTQYGASKLNDRDFSAWLKSSVTRKTYPALRDYLELRTLLPKRRKSKDEPKVEDIVTPVTVSAPEPVVPIPAIAPEPYTGPYGFVELMSAWDPGIRRNEWESAGWGAHFYEDYSHWFVEQRVIRNRGWDAVPIQMDNGDMIEVPLTPGFVWWSDNRRTSLAMI
jgi:Putative amidoligase enzyme